MARIIIVEGKSGTGKTTGLRNLPWHETFYLSPNGKGLSFQGWRTKCKPYDPTTSQGNVVRVAELKDLTAWVNTIAANAAHIKYLIIDDFTHFFNRRIFSPHFIAQGQTSDKWERWNSFGADVFNAFWSKASSLREDLTIIVNHHVAAKEDGSVGFKTAGKLLDEKIDLPSEVEYILHTRVFEGENGKMAYKYMTNTDGVHEAKTPMGIFEEQFIDNDIYEVIKKINAYEYGTEVE